MPLISHDTQMRHHRAHKVEDEADARRHTEKRPPDTKNYAQGTGKLISCQKRKILQRCADDLWMTCTIIGIVANLPDAGKRHGDPAYSLGLYCTSQRYLEARNVLAAYRLRIIVVISSGF